MSGVAVSVNLWVMFIRITDFSARSSPPPVGRMLFLLGTGGEIFSRLSGHCLTRLVTRVESIMTCLLLLSLLWGHVLLGRQITSGEMMGPVSLFDQESV